MVDELHPTTQFHPYQPPTAPPQSEVRKTGAVDAILSRLGVSPSRIDDVTRRLNRSNVRGWINKARDWSRNNGALALGGLAAAVIGAGLLTRRSRRVRVDSGRHGV